MKITVFGGAHSGNNPAFLEAAADLGAGLARREHTILYGGGHVGMMGALADAALEEGGEVIGIIPGFMVEREWAHLGLHHLHVTETMAERKTKMEEMGDGYVAMPGGTGTLEEITEIIAKIGLELTTGPCVLLNIQGYYDPLEKMLNSMVSEGYLDRSVREKIFFAPTVESAIEHLVGGL